MANYTMANGTSSSDNAPSAFVTLVSSDGFEFHVRRSAACVSGTIRRMLDTKSMPTARLLLMTTIRLHIYIEEADDWNQTTSAKPLAEYAVWTALAEWFWKRWSNTSTTTKNIEIATAYQTWKFHLSSAWSC